MSALSRALTGVQNRQAPSDVFYPPNEVVDMALNMCSEDIEEEEKTIWYDPFKGVGAYYDKFPEGQDKDWGEIMLGRDFYNYTPEKWGDEYDKKIICSNPPYSHLNGVIDRLIKLNPDIINLTIGALNLTKNRWKRLKDAGYNITALTACSVKGWFGQTMIWQFEKNPVKIYKKIRGEFVEVDRSIDFKLNKKRGTHDYIYE